MKHARPSHRPASAYLDDALSHVGEPGDAGSGDAPSREVFSPANQPETARSRHAKPSRRPPSHQSPQPGTFVRYGYSLAAATIAVLVMVTLGFALVSSLRHILWWQAMGSHQNVPFGVIALFVMSVTLTVGIWYRILHAALLEHRQRQQFIHQVRPLLAPLPSRLNIPFSGRAEWYLIDTEDRLAFTWGLRQCRIAISSGLWDAVDNSARRAIAYHELAHVRNRDSWQQAFLQILAKALGPVGIGALYKRYLVRREILADAFAIDASEGDDAPLLEAMLAVARAPGNLMPRVNLGGSLDARIAFMETGMLPDWWEGSAKTRLISTGIALLLTVGEGMVVWCH